MNRDKCEEGGAPLNHLASRAVAEKAPYSFNGSVPLIDAWLLACVAATLDTVKDAFETQRFHESVQSIYQFFWNDFCDWYIEWIKPELTGANRERTTIAWQNLFAAFEAALRLLHPVMPFLTEELWHQLPQRPGAKSIALERYPESRESWRNAAALEEFELVQEVVKSVRAIRADMKLDPKKRIAAEFSSERAAIRETIAANLDGIVRLALLTELKITDAKLTQASGGFRSTSLFDVRVPYIETIDVAAELMRLKKEHERLTRDIASKERQLGDDTFRSRAPEKIISGLQGTLEERRIEIQKVAARIRELESGG